MPTVKNVVTPDLGGATDVNVIEILVKPGDHITKDTSIMTLESDKATLEVPAGEEGTVKEIKVKIGDKIGTGSLLLTVETKVTETKTEKKVNIEEPNASQASDKKPKEKKTKVSKQTEEPKHVLTGTIQTTSDIHAGPGVRRMARELGVNLTLVPGSGPKQRIIKEDIQGFVKQQLSQIQQNQLPSPISSLPSIDFTKFGDVDVQALSRIKKVSGKNLQRNWMMIPHVTQFGEADITTCEEFRKMQKEELLKQKIKLTPLVFVMKAVVASLRAFPHFNASLDSSGEQLILKKYFHIGVAVDTPDGLVVPVIHDVDKKGLIALAKELADVSERARNKQLTLQNMQGGCFSISSLGGIGGSAFTPIINYPEVAILGVSKASYKPVYEEGEGDFVPRLMLPLSLSYDHRVIDGADGARFMNHLISMLSDIRNLLL